MNGYLSNNDLSLWKREGYYTPPESLFAILNGGWPMNTAVLFRKEVIEKVGLSDLSVGAAGDLDFQLRIAARFPIVVRKEPCVIFRIHDLPGPVYLKDIWPGRLKLVHNITKDERIPSDVRLRVEQLMMVGLINNLFNMGFFFIKRKNFEDAYEITDILSKQYNQKTKAMILYTAAKIFQYLPMGNKVYDSMAKIRRFLMQYESEALQKQYGSYDQYLQK